ncbi:202_t:CDS:2, partial [Racocetra persica]
MASNRIGSSSTNITQSFLSREKRRRHVFNEEPLSQFPKNDKSSSDIFNLSISERSLPLLSPGLQEHNRSLTLFSLNKSSESETNSINDKNSEEDTISSLEPINLNDFIVQLSTSRQSDNTSSNSLSNSSNNSSNNSPNNSPNLLPYQLLNLENDSMIIGDNIS